VEFHQSARGGQRDLLQHAADGDGIEGDEAHVNIRQPHDAGPRLPVEAGDGRSARASKSSSRRSYVGELRLSGAAKSEFVGIESPTSRANVDVAAFQRIAADAVVKMC